MFVYMFYIQGFSKYSIKLLIKKGDSINAKHFLLGSI